MKIIIIERKNSVDGLNSRLVNLERIRKMENRFDEASQNSVQGEKKMKNMKERLRYLKDRIKKIPHSVMSPRRRILQR